MDAPVIKSTEIITELARGKNNPRNSEGDFAVLKNGSILFAYSRYGGDSAHDDAACDVAGMISRDGGKTFEHLPYKLAEAKEHDTLNIMSVSLKRLPNGELCLFYLCKKGPQSEVYLKRAVGDETKFGAPELCLPKKRGVYYVVNNCRICVTKNGEILLPMAKHKIINGSGIYFGTAQIFAADSNGKNWHERSKTIRMPLSGHSGTGLQEPGLVELDDGRLYGYFRTDRHFQYESFSSDNGKTWTTPVPSLFTSPDSPMLIMKNPYSGIFYSVWNPIPNYNGRLDKEKRWISAGRTPFVIAQSENGTDFSKYTVIEDAPSCGYCYPAMLFLNEKEMLMSYCCGGPDDGMCLTRTRIRHITLE